jgi:FkbM family methyltransferase
MKLHKELARAFGWELQHIRKDQPTLETHLSQLLPKLGIDCVLDVGANQGQYGSMLRKAGYRGRIVSFEPVKASFDILKDRASRDPHWRVCHYALGAKAGTKTIHVSRSSVMASFLDATEYSHHQFPEGMPVVREEKVQIRTLDQVFAEATEGLKTPRVFLKMDTQGYDLQVFAGAKRSLPQVRGLQTEISIQAIYEKMPDYLQSLAVYTKTGFVMSGLYPVSRDKQTLALIELDCVMRRVPKSEKKSSSPTKKKSVKKRRS